MKVLWLFLTVMILIVFWCAVYRIPWTQRGRWQLEISIHFNNRQKVKISGKRKRNKGIQLKTHFPARKMWSGFLERETLDEKQQDREGEEGTGGSLACFLEQADTYSLTAPAESWKNVTKGWMRMEKSPVCNYWLEFLLPAPPTGLSSRLSNSPSPSFLLCPFSRPPLSKRATPCLWSWVN